MGAILFPSGKLIKVIKWIDLTDLIKYLRIFPACAVPDPSSTLSLWLKIFKPLKNRSLPPFPHFEAFLS